MCGVVWVVWCGVGGVVVVCGVGDFAICDVVWVGVVCGVKWMVVCGGGDVSWWWWCVALCDVGGGVWVCMLVGVGVELGL